MVGGDSAQRSVRRTALTNTFLRRAQPSAHLVTARDMSSLGAAGAPRREAHSVDFSRTPFFASTSLRRSQKCRRFTDAPADQSTTASAATRLAAHHSHLSDRARTALLPSAAPDADFNAHGKRRGGCLQLRCRQTLPALPLWQIKARRFDLSEDRSHFCLRLRHRCGDRVSLLQQSVHLP